MPGFFSKWAIACAAGSGNWLEITGVAALMFSAFLTAIYLMTVVCRAYFSRDVQSGGTCILERPKMKGVQIVLCIIIISMGILNRAVQAGLDSWLF